MPPEINREAASGVGVAMRFAILTILITSPAFAQEATEAPLGDVARSFRKKPSSAPAVINVDDDKLSKADPDKWSYGTSGVAGPHHLSGEYFKSVTGAKLLHVPYKGGGPAMTDLMGGQVPMLFSSLGPIVGAVKSGKIRPLAVTSLKRSAAFPDVPTTDELGLKGFESTGWYGLVGPAGLAPEAVTKISQILAKSAEDRNMHSQINATGCDTDILTPAQTVEKVKTDLAKWGKVVKDANIKPE